MPESTGGRGAPEGEGTLFLGWEGDVRWFLQRGEEESSLERAWGGVQGGRSPTPEAQRSSGLRRSPEESGVGKTRST